MEAPAASNAACARLSLDSYSNHEEESADAPLDELPSYDEASSAPAYSRSDPQSSRHDLDGRSLVFSLRQLGRKRQAFVSMGPPMNILRGANFFTEVDTNLTLSHLTEALPYPWNTTSREFIIEHKAGAGLSKSKPDFVVTGAEREPRRQSLPPTERRRSSFLRRESTRDTTPERRGSVASSNEGGRRTQAVASVRFARSGPLPWVPRAQITYEQVFVDAFTHEGHYLDERRAHDMTLARSQLGWTINILDREYIWLIVTKPTRLVFVDVETEVVKATFFYSEAGSWAMKDAEVGRLSVPLQALPDGEDNARGRSGLQDGFLEYVICSLSTVITHWRNEGKVLVNADLFGQSRNDATDEQ